MLIVFFHIRDLVPHKFITERRIINKYYLAVLMKKQFMDYAPPYEDPM